MLIVRLKITVQRLVSEIFEWKIRGWLKCVYAALRVRLGAKTNKYRGYMFAHPTMMSNESCNLC